MIVKPMNSQKLKHRDRTGIITKIEQDDWKGTLASFKFNDTNRIGKVDISDLDDNF